MQQRTPYITLYIRNIIKTCYYRSAGTIKLKLPINFLCLKMILPFEIVTKETKVVTV